MPKRPLQQKYRLQEWSLGSDWCHRLFKTTYHFWIFYVEMWLQRRCSVLKVFFKTIFISWTEQWKSNPLVRSSHLPQINREVWNFTPLGWLLVSNTSNNSKTGLLYNMFTNRAELCKIAKHPGKTQRRRRRKCSCPLWKLCLFIPSPLPALLKGRCTRVLFCV